MADQLPGRMFLLKDGRPGRLSAFDDAMVVIETPDGRALGGAYRKWAVPDPRNGHAMTLSELRFADPDPAPGDGWRSMSEHHRSMSPAAFVLAFKGWEFRLGPSGTVTLAGCDSDGYVRFDCGALTKLASMSSTWQFRPPQSAAAPAKAACGEANPNPDGGRCCKRQGYDGSHRDEEHSTWAAAAYIPAVGERFVPGNPAIPAHKAAHDQAAKDRHVSLPAVLATRLMAHLNTLQPTLRRHPTAMQREHLEVGRLLFDALVAAGVGKGEKGGA